MVQKISAALAFILVLLCQLISFVEGVPRLTPPHGSLVVRSGTKNPNEFSTISAAVRALPNDTSHQTIFIFGGTYAEQVSISRTTGPVTIYGETPDTSTFESNTVLILSSGNATTAGSNDLSGTLRIHMNDFSMYNVDVKNGVGPGVQAIALSNYGSRTGLYACSFIGYQDTLLANQGTQVYLKGYIEGAVDFIFGRLGQAYFEQNTIALSHGGNITASGREADDVAIYILNHNKVVTTADAKPSVTQGHIYLGRPWGDFARVIFLNTEVQPLLDPSVWIDWHPDDQRIDHVFFAEFNTSGPGVDGRNLTRPSFATLLNETEAAQYTIATAVGDDFASWVDGEYLLES